jgi:hypothetical protein
MQSNLMTTGLILATIVVQCHTPGTQPPPPIEKRTPSGSISNSSPSKTSNKDSASGLTPKVSASASEGKGKNLPACVQTDCNCSDFKTQAEAQAVLDAFPDDPHKLDRNHDGKACESLP